jgi:hypothetical protein
MPNWVVVLDVPLQSTASTFEAALEDSQSLPPPNPSAHRSNQPWPRAVGGGVLASTTMRPPAKVEAAATSAIAWPPLPAHPPMKLRLRRGGHHAVVCRAWCAAAVARCQLVAWLASEPGHACRQEILCRWRFLPPKLWQHSAYAADSPLWER